MAVAPHLGVHHECVVFVTRDVDDSCRLARFASLLDTAGRGRDVWLLHGADHTPSTSALGQLRQSRSRLHVAAQPFVPPPEEGAHAFGLRHFGGQFIGYSKAAFLLWLVQNGTQCTHTWQVEDDVFYTGSWHEVFDAHLALHDDLIATSSNSTGNDHWAHSCSLGNASCYQALGHLESVSWPILRISSRLAAELRESLLIRRAKGFHEVLLYAVCANTMWCSSAPLRRERVGNVLSGHADGVPKAKSLQTFEWLAYELPKGRASQQNILATRQLTRGSIHQAVAGKLFHPAKCEADERLGVKAGWWARGAGEQAVAEIFGGRQYAVSSENLQHARSSTS